MRRCMRTGAADHLIRQAVLREHAASKADHTLVAIYVYYSAHTHSRLSTSLSMYAMLSRADAFETSSNHLQA